MSSRRKSASFFPASGWRRTATVNTVLAAAVSVFLIVVLAWSTVVAGSVDSSLVFYHGSCAASNRVNLLVHLVINIVSTCIISSSNYFMQVLNSPTREEVDKAHAKSRSLDIGVPSLRNVRQVSTHKAVLWALFILSSVPIHLLFNSAVFQIEFEDAGFFMAMATEGFVNGQEYHGPGASLVYPGASLLPNTAGVGNLSGYGNYTGIKPTWGSFADITQFLDQSSAAVKNLSSVVEVAQSWTRLDAHDCRAQYGTCTPRTDYGSVVLVVNTQFQNTSSVQEANPDGFIVQDIYNLTSLGVPWNPHNYTTPELRAYWDQFGSTDRPNALWFSAWCRISASVDSHGCAHDCGYAVGLPSLEQIETEVLAPHISNTTTSWDIPLGFYNSPTEISPFSDWSASAIEERPTFNTSNIAPGSVFEITHCYAQPLQLACKVALSNTLLLTVTLCVVLKTVLCLLVRALMRGDPLVTLGDALASFITRPDHTTKGKATMSFSADAIEVRNGWEHASMSREWRKESLSSVAAGISVAVWFRTYALIIVIVIATAALLSVAAQDIPISQDTNAFAHVQNTAIVGLETLSKVSFLGKVLIANTPQLVLSFCYFAYNSFFTRGCAEIEWNSYSLAYKPLRVSEPAEGQVSTYRLQLPYKYSIPLLAASILLHWLVSNAIYIFIIDGDYLDDAIRVTLPGISDAAFVGIGFSSRVIMIVLILALVAAFLPLLLQIRLKGKMVICGSDSAIMSAACHVSTLNVQTRASASDAGIEMQPLMSGSGTTIQEAASNEKRRTEFGTGTAELAAAESSEDRDDNNHSQALLQISRSPLRWGVVTMAPQWYTQFSDTGEAVEHLTFGSESQGVGEPQTGRYYA